MTGMIGMIHEFTKEVAGSLGAFSTTNQWFMDNLVEQL
jgi:hypothetical protein